MVVVLVSVVLSVVVSASGEVPPPGVLAASLPVFVVVLLLLDVPPPPAGEGLTIVVLCSVVGDAAGVTVSVRCSHEERSAALAMMQMYFVIGR